jgi:hypothetical protein
LCASNADTNEDNNADTNEHNNADTNPYVDSDAYLHADAYCNDSTRQLGQLHRDYDGR